MPARNIEQRAFADEMDSGISKKPPVDAAGMENTKKKDEGDAIRSSGSSTTQGAEEMREEARRNNPNGQSEAVGGISVSRAEAEFAHLQRELSHSSRLGRVQS